MKTLSNPAFHLSESYLTRKGRPLDLARFAFHFQDGDKELIGRILQAYQNSDGGFGHALEPDLRTPASSAVATANALKIFVEADLPSDDAMIRRTLTYLERTLDRERLIWPIAPQGLKKFAHAPWWGGDDVIKDFGGCLANPRAMIVGALLQYQDAFDSTLLDQLLASTIRHLETLPDKMEMHDLQCYLYLADAPQLPADVKKMILPKLRRAVRAVVTTDSSQWSSYSVKPLTLCSHPESFVYQEIGDAVTANLDYEIKAQGADGSWTPNWSWADYNPEGWSEARREWTGHLTVEALITLKNFSRIEEI